MASPAHSRLPPSKAEVWVPCTASIGFVEANAAILPSEGSIFADEGTAAHAIAAHYLGKGAMPDLSKYDATQQEEMKTYAREYAEFVTGLVSPGDRLMVERRVPLFYLPTQSGTVDAAIIGPKSIYIVDFKYGAGVGVYAKENKQMASYAESLLHELQELQDVPDDVLVTLAIRQPRDRNDPEPMRLWAISRKDLRDFCAPIDAAAKLIQARDAKKLTFVAGPHCDKGFCRARGICKAYGTQGLEVISDAAVEKMDQIHLPSPNALTREQRVKVVLARKTLEKWLEAVEDQEVAELMAGAPHMGLKLVEGKSNRAWADEIAVDALLANHLTAEQRRKPWEVLSPAQADKALKGLELSTKFVNRLAELTVKPQGKPSLVPESDKRPALDFRPTEGLTKLATEAEEESVL